MKRAVLTALFTAAVLSIAGCNLVKSAAFIIEGPPSVQAEHELEDRPLLVYVDDRAGAIGLRQRQIRRLIADRVGDHLIDEGLISTRINSRDAIAIIEAEDSHSNLMSIEEIGDAVGAELVIFIEVLAFQLTPDGVTPRPSGNCRVRLIDAKDKVRLYPPPPEPPRLVPVALREVSTEAYRSQASRLKVYEDLAEEMASQVAKLFYKHAYKEVGENLNRR